MTQHFFFSLWAEATHLQTIRPARPQLGDVDVSDARKEVDKGWGRVLEGGVVIHYYICSSPLAPEA